MLYLQDGGQSFAGDVLVTLKAQRLTTLNRRFRAAETDGKTSEVEDHLSGEHEWFVVSLTAEKKQDGGLMRAEEEHRSWQSGSLHLSISPGWLHANQHQLSKRRRQGSFSKA